MEYGMSSVRSLRRDDRAARSAEARQSLQESFRGLDVLAGLGADWDPNGSVAPSPVAILAARTLLREAVDKYYDSFGDAIRPTFTGPMADGGVHIEWEFSRAELAFDFSPTAHIGFLLVYRGNGLPSTVEGDHINAGAAHGLLQFVLNDAARD